MGPQRRGLATLEAQLGKDTVDQHRVRRSLISVSNKAGVLDLAAFLHSNQVEILSTGTPPLRVARPLTPPNQAGPLAQSELKGSQWLTCQSTLDSQRSSEEESRAYIQRSILHPTQAEDAVQIHGGILAVRGNDAHEADLSAHGIGPIDMVLLSIYLDRTCTITPIGSH